jgi:hypothetical protein
MHKGINAPCSEAALDDIVEIQVVSGREWMALCWWRQSWYSLIIGKPYLGFSQTQLRVRVRLGLRFSLHVVGALEQGLCNSRGTKGEGRGLFCNSCLNTLSVTVTVSVPRWAWLKFQKGPAPILSIPTLLCRASPLAYMTVGLGVWEMVYLQFKVSLGTLSTDSEASLSARGVSYPWHGHGHSPTGMVTESVIVVSSFTSITLQNQIAPSQITITDNMIY